MMRSSFQGDKILGPLLEGYSNFSQLATGFFEADFDFMSSFLSI